MKRPGFAWIYPICLAAILAGFAACTPQKKTTAPPTQELPDLTVLEIAPPEWVDKDGEEFALVKIKARNAGKAPSAATSLKIADFDPPNPVNDVVDSDEHTEDENGKAAVEQSAIVAVPPLKPGETVTLEARFKYWVFDPNCELEAVIDFENKIEESDEKNNAKQFVQGG